MASPPATSLVARPPLAGWIPLLIWPAMAAAGWIVVPRAPEILVLASLAMAGLAGAVVLAPRPQMIAAILGFAMLVPLLKPIGFPREVMLLPDLMFYCMAAGAIVRGPRGGYRSLSAAAVVALGAWAVFFVISLGELANANVPDPVTALEGFRKTALSSVALVVGVFAMSRRNASESAGSSGEHALWFIVRTLVIVASIAALYALKQAVWWTSFDTRIVTSNSAGHWTGFFAGRYRPVSFFSGPFHLGVLGLQLFGLGAALRFHCTSSRRSRLDGWLGRLALALGAAAALVSLTRTNIAGLGLLGGLMLLITSRTAPRILTIISSGGFALAVLVVVTLSGNAGSLERTLTGITNPLADSRFTNRYLELDRTVDSIAAQSFTGYGMGSAGDTLGPRFGNRGVHYSTHNLGLKLLVETGVIGTLAFAVMLGCWFWAFGHAWANRRVGASGGQMMQLQIAGAALVVPVLFNGLTNSGIETYPMNLLMWFGLGAGVAICPNLWLGTRNAEHTA